MRLSARFPTLLAALLLALSLGGCSTAPERVDGTPEGAVIEAQRDVSSEFDPGVKHAIDEIHDPWEGMNRGIYQFNTRFDRYVMLPVVDGYRTVMPDYLEDRVSDFMSNVSDIRNLLNSVLQLKPKVALRTFSRLVFNTTFGVLGLWDLAKHMDLPQQREDFGQTLGHYGVGPGPYLVLPILGPSSVRDTSGLVVDSAAFSAIDPLDFDDHEERQIAYTLLNAIDTRKRLAFRYYESGSPFEYELVRSLITRARELQIEK
ncbi:MAG TPA: VacJ family lipoprotein [Gammaproteobacteria bacterium]